MSSKPKHSGGPKTDKGKAISSRNSTTHGLTARRWLNNNEQSLFDMTVEAFMDDFDPQSYIEKVLISKMAECTVRLMRIQQIENSMFDLASSEAGHPEESIKSLDNTSDKLIKAVYEASASNWQFNAREYAKKTIILDEIDRQNLSEVTGWTYIEDNMHLTADYICKKCIKENISLYEFISRETDQSNTHRVKVIIVSASSPKEKPLSRKDIFKDIQRIKSSALQEYLEIIIHRIAIDIQVQYILKDLDKRTQQIKDAAIPDTQKLSLIQRYRTADERLFSKSLGELLELQKRRKTI